MASKIIKSAYDPSKGLSLEGERVDPFYYDQPPLEFIEELKRPIYERRPEGYGTRRIEDGEINADGIYLDLGDFQGCELLDTACDSFARFTEIYGIRGERYPVTVKKCDTDAPEWHKIIFSEEGTTILASDIEGARRGILYLEGELIANEGAFFKKGEIERTARVKARITRGFFSPTNRPPKFGDELLDEVDYYPEGYLDRLAHDGTNGIWIYTSFKQLMRSSYFERCGEECDRRIEKLKSVVKKCARYGVKVYLLAIEPAYLTDEMAESHEYMTGGFTTSGHYAICLSTREGRDYLSASVENLFRLVHDLGGYIDITAGERVTSCASFVETHKACPRCRKRPQGEMLAETANLIKESMRRAGSSAEFISWTYGHKTWAESDILEYVRKSNTDVALMQNFEEFAYADQLGKTRLGKDYWLSFPGPGELFRSTAKEANAHSKRLYAKMQICCSHELATVPYIPAPGLVFEKMKGARAFGVEGVVECWYFGNYPSVMSRAAGELAFESDFSDKDAFLLRLASVYYGKSLAKKVTAAWKSFEEGYKNYPLNIMFSYYGPMHDAVVWELQLKPKDNYLPRTWLLLDKPDGDRIYEALWFGHTLDEAINLAGRINEGWKRGLSELPLDPCDEMSTISRALGILFASGERILRFYKYRADLGMRRGEAGELILKMRSIVLAEIEASRDMKELCLIDKRLGYHSEAEGFKFFPKKLDSRIAQLEGLLETEFKEIEARIEKGLAPLEFYLAKENGEYLPDSYHLTDGEGKWRRLPECEHSFRLSCNDEEIILNIDAKNKASIIFGFEFEPLIPTPTVTVNSLGEIGFVSQALTHQSLFGDAIELEKRKYSVTVDQTDFGTSYTVKMRRSDFEWNENTPFRIRMKVGGAPLKKSKIGLRLLAKWDEYPDTHVWVIPST